MEMSLLLDCIKSFMISKRLCHCDKLMGQLIRKIAQCSASTLVTSNFGNRNTQVATPTDAYYVMRVQVCTIPLAVITQIKSGTRHVTRPFRDSVHHSDTNISVAGSVRPL
jgi:hypothetical protein